MFTAGNYRDYRAWSKFSDELVPQYIIPAAEAGRYRHTKTRENPVLEFSRVQTGIHEC